MYLLRLNSGVTSEFRMEGVMPVLELYDRDGTKLIRLEFRNGMALKKLAFHVLGAINKMSKNENTKP